MFDISFWEMGLIGVVALLVIGPERLPGVARTVGLWIGRMRSFVSSVQADINQELSKAEQLKQLLEEQTKIKSAHEIIEETANQVRETLSVPTAKPDYLLKAEPATDAVAESAVGPAPKSDPKQPTQASRAVAAATQPVSAAVASASPSAKTAINDPKEPAKADDVKHDQSA